VAVDLSGWSVQYASASGASWQKTPLAGVLAPGRYFLVQQAAGTGGTQQLPAPDAAGNIAMAANAGKVALVRNDAALSGACPLGASVADFVGYGGGVSCSEGSGAAPAPGNTTASIRKDEGCADTDNNASDFAAGQPAPRNSAVPAHACASASQAKNAGDALQTKSGGDASSMKTPPPLLSTYMRAERLRVWFDAGGYFYSEEFCCSEEFSGRRPPADSKRSRRGASACGPRGTRAGPPQSRGASP
jgi:Tfp pilus assembly major pilin PilA